MAIALALAAGLGTGAAGAQSEAPTIGHAWAGTGYEVSPETGPHGPLRQALVVEGSGTLLFIPLEFGVRAGWAVLDEGTRTAEGLVLGLRVGVDFSVIVSTAIDSSGPLSLLNPVLGIGADFAYATGTRGEVGRGFVYVANTSYILCNVGVRISADLSLTSWAAAPPTFYAAVVVGQRWVWDDAVVSCNAWDEYRHRGR